MKMNFMAPSQPIGEGSNDGRSTVEDTDHICTSYLKVNTKNYIGVFMCNNGALQIARKPQMTPQTKHYRIKHHVLFKYVSTRDIELH